jgi:taurine transport system permease protein
MARENRYYIDMRKSGPLYEIINYLLGWQIFRIVLSFAPLVIVWWLLTYLEVWPRLYFPPPSEVVGAFFELIKNGALPIHIFASLRSFAVAAVLAVAAGIALGVLMGTNKYAYRFLLPLVSYFQSIAEIGWLPLVIIWIGYGFTSIVIVIFYTIVLTVALNTMVGVRQVPKNLVNSIKTLGGNWSDITFSVYLPGALPGIVTGTRLGLGYGWRALIAAEILVGQEGLGFMIFDARQFQATDQILLGMVIMGLLWLTTDRLILKPIEVETIERWGMVVKSR